MRVTREWGRVGFGVAEGRLGVDICPHLKTFLLVHLFRSDFSYSKIATDLRTLRTSRPLHRRFP